MPRKQIISQKESGERGPEGEILYQGMAVSKRLLKSWIREQNDTAWFATFGALFMLAYKTQCRVRGCVAELVDSALKGERLKTDS